MPVKKQSLVYYTTLINFEPCLGALILISQLMYNCKHNNFRKRRCGTIVVCKMFVTIAGATLRRTPVT